MPFFIPPTLVKLEGHIAFGLSVSVWMCVCWVGYLLVRMYASGCVCKGCG